ncbi:Vps4 [Clohesyomyces aquaticus]|uniref:Vps4 n=1 Tax=Clohesyomyces aquaticus TaxID=1231657 RepID=A0A1Y1XVG7_9PLEO|nr:Vps4 [Clohesyomyces aquaticus]
MIPDISNLSISSTSESPTPTTDSLLHPNATSRDRRPASSASHRQDDEENKKLKDALEGAIVSENPNVHWDDVAGLEVAKEELQEAVVLPMKFPQLFTGRRQSRKGILLYGPPGTGKSYLAKAVATEVDATLFSVSSSDLVSKWMGESERQDPSNFHQLKTLFDMARERKPSVIFIDELEGIASSRDSGGDNEHTNRIKTEILIQMDGVGKDATGILVLAATNLPWKLDAALRRRFQKRIHIALPNMAARKEMFETGALHAQCNLEEKDLEQLASMTEGYSGSDISIVVQDTLMIPVKKIRTAKYWRKIVKDGTEKLEPCDQTDTGALPMTWKQVPSDKLFEPSVLPKDFFTALSKVKPSVSQDDFQKTKEWTEEFGEEGA